MLAGNETQSYAPTQFIAGDTPAIATENGTLALGQNLPVRTVIGRVTASGQLVQCDPAATDGSESAVGILVHATDATAAAAPIQFYKAGNFFADALGWHVGFASADAKKAAFDGTAVVIK